MLTTLLLTLALSGCNQSVKSHPKMPEHFIFRDCKIITHLDGKVSCSCDRITWVKDAKNPAVEIAQCTNKVN